MSCPADLEPYSKAYMLAQKEADSNMWAWWGTYGLSATLTAIAVSYTHLTLPTKANV